MKFFLLLLTQFSILSTFLRRAQTTTPLRNSQQDGVAVKFKKLSLATGWSEPVPGRDYPAVDHHLFTAHPRIPFIKSWLGA